MKITIAGSLGNVSKPLAQELLGAGHELTIITSSTDRKADIEALGAAAAVGSVGDAAFLERAFTGADAVYTMTPPGMGGSNIIANTAAAGKAYAEAIRNAGVTRVVMLSSIGADQSGENGPIRGLYHIEQIYHDLPSVAVTYLRAGFFYNNFFNDIPLIRGLNIMGGNYPGTTKIPLVHPADIAAAAAGELQKEAAGKEVRYIVSDERTPEEAASTLGAAIGKPGLPWVEFTDDQSLQGMLQAGLPAELAELYTEMGRGLRTGIIQRHFYETGAPVTGLVKLEQFAGEFAAKF